MSKKQMIVRYTRVSKKENLNLMLILFICITIFFSCNPFSIDKESESALKKEMKKVQQMITEEIGEAKANDESCCKVLAFGAKPCGGPWKYVPYSAHESDEKKLLKLAGRYYKANKKFNELTGQISDCMFVGEPPVTLSDGNCRINNEID